MAPADDRCLVCDGEVDASPAIHAHDRVFSMGEDFTVHCCAACGLGLTRPRLSGDALSAHYPQDYPSWRVHGGLRGQLDAAKARMLARIPPYGRHRAAGGRLLDVGLGRGDLAWAFARSGWDAHGLDMSPAAVQAGRARGIDARVGTLAHPPWPPGSFDLIVLSHVLEHVDDPVAELRSARELLRPGGTAIVAVPAWDSWHRRVFGGRWAHADVPRHLQHFTVPSLNEAARAAGFSTGSVRRATTMVGLPVSLLYATAGRWPAAARGRLAFLAAAAAAYPLVWAIGRPLGGDCTYVELRTETPAG
jgi:SAM-dependent methyltransferase